MPSRLAVLRENVMHATVADVLYALTPYALYAPGVHRVSLSNGVQRRRRRLVDRVMDGVLAVLLPPVSPSASVRFHSDKRNEPTNQRPLDPAALPPPYMVPNGDTMHRALSIPDIVALIAEQLSPQNRQDRRCLAQLAAVSSLWFAHCIPRLYDNADEMSLYHLTRVLMSSPREEGLTWAYERFAAYSNYMSTLELRSSGPHMRSNGEGHLSSCISALQILRHAPSSDGVWSRSFRLRSLAVELPPGTQLHSTALLLSASLKYLSLHVAGHRPSLNARREIEAYCYALSEWTPQLAELHLLGSSFEEVTEQQVLEWLGYLRRLRTVQLPNNRIAFEPNTVSVMCPRADVLITPTGITHPGVTFTTLAAVHMRASPDVAAEFLKKAELPLLRQFEIIIEAPEDAEALTRMHVVLVEQVPMLEQYTLLRTGAFMQQPFPSLPTASDFAPFAEATNLHALHVRIFLAPDELPQGGPDDHGFLLNLLGHSCRKLRSLIWDWPVAAANLPTPPVVAQFAAVAHELEELSMPANLTLAQRTPTIPQLRLTHMVLGSSTVYINQPRAIAWLSELWPNARIEDLS